MTPPPSLLERLSEHLCRGGSSNVGEEENDMELSTTSGDDSGRGRTIHSRYITTTTTSTEEPSSSTSNPTSSSSDDDDSQLYNSINRLFSSTYTRDPRFPSPPRHYSPDAIPHPHSNGRIPPLHLKTPYVRPTILNPYSDVYSSTEQNSAHLINPLSSFFSDLTIALEDLLQQEKELESLGTERPLFGHQILESDSSGSGNSGEGKVGGIGIGRIERDPSGLLRPRKIPAPRSSVESLQRQSAGGDGE